MKTLLFLYNSFLENNTLAYNYILWTILLDNNPLLPEQYFFKQYFGQARSEADTWIKPINENCWTPLLWVLYNTSILENTTTLAYENVPGHPPADPINPLVVQHDQGICFQWRLLFYMGKKYILEAKTIFWPKTFFIEAATMIMSNYFFFYRGKYSYYFY